MIRKNSISTVLLTATILLSSAFASAQAAQPAQQPSMHMHHEMPKPTNLQVLPKDIAPGQLMAIMHQFEGQLGVRCSFCHAGNEQTHHLDFASDAKPEKAAARVMMQMTHELNAKYLAELPDHGSMEQVSCGTCHRGQSTPAEFTPAPEEHEHMPPMSGK